MGWLDDVGRWADENRPLVSVSLILGGAVAVLWALPKAAGAAPGGKLQITVPASWMAGTSDITLCVKDPQGKPVVGASVVYIASPAPEWVGTPAGDTLHDGCMPFGGKVDVGMWKVRASKLGYDPSDEVAFEITSASVITANGSNGNGKTPEPLTEVASERGTTTVTPTLPPGPVPVPKKWAAGDSRGVEVVGKSPYVCIGTTCQPYGVI